LRRALALLPGGRRAGWDRLSGESKMEVLRRLEASAGADLPGSSPAAPAPAQVPPAPLQPPVVESSAGTLPAMAPPPAEALPSLEMPPSEEVPPSAEARPTVGSPTVGVQVPAGSEKVGGTSSPTNSNPTVGTSSSTAGLPSSGTGPSGCAPVPQEARTLDDGRQVLLFGDGKALTAAVAPMVAEAGKAAIAEKGAFSIAVSGGEVATALGCLAQQPGVEFSKFHVFFCYDALEPGAPPCHVEAHDTWLAACGIPAKQVHAMPSGLPCEAAAAQYTAEICMQPEEVVADSAEGLPSVDLVLLCTGKDGRCGGIRPASPEAAAIGSGQVVLFDEAAAVGGVARAPQLALSLDFMSAARRALLLAGGAGCSGMVRRALATSSAAGPDCPAALVRAPMTTWLVTSESVAEERAAERS